MKYLVSSQDLEFTSTNDGTIEFRHNGTLYRSVVQATFDNNPNNSYSTYSTHLVCPEDEEYPEDFAGKIEWDIINPDTDDESDACDWDKFDVYVY